MATIHTKEPVSKKAEAVSPASSPPSSMSPGGGIQFAKAALVFQNQLGDIRDRKKQPTATTTDVTENETAKPADSEEQLDLVVARRLRIVRLMQSAMTATLSIAIAVLQAKAYSDYQSTKNVPGAWPTHPNLLPTILLMVVAVTGAVFDLSCLFAFLFPRRIAVLYRIAATSHTILTTVKGLSYTLTSVVCRGGFNYGNQSNTNADLWSWTCSPQGDAMSSVNQSEANCVGQTCAWALAMAQIGIESFGIAAAYLVEQWTRRGQKAAMVAAGGNVEAQFDKWGDEVNDMVGQYTPLMDKKDASAK
ncbi:hypothetical protein QBC43DRAFT_359391 [Cladorrhinum sp. PSN259]|nr:hypothetical protein QBC43DRAFT_359391 [Cladorrhinum sp. PSN259]